MDILIRLLSTFGFIILSVIAATLSIWAAGEYLKVRSDPVRRMLSMDKIEKDQGLETYIGAAEGRFRLLLSGSLAFMAQSLAFWVLTHEFPYPLLIAGLLVTILTMTLQDLIGGVVGLTLTETVEKNLATSIRIQEQLNRARKITSAAVSLAVLLSWIACLVVFWNFGIGETRAVIWIAVLQFGIPSGLLVFVNAYVHWPIMTSEFVDNDFRDSRLIDSFSNCLRSSVYFAYPYFLVVSATLAEQRALVVSMVLPLFIFLFLNLIPYFVGLFRHRARRKVFAEFRRRWLSDFSALLYLPKTAGFRSELLTNDIARLKAEIAKISTSIGIENYGVSDIRVHHKNELLKIERTAEGTVDPEAAVYFEAKSTEAERALSREEGLTSYVGGIFWGATAAIIIWIFSVYDDDIQARLKENYGLDQIIESSNATYEDSEFDGDLEGEYEEE